MSESNRAASAAARSGAPPPPPQPPQPTPQAPPTPPTPQTPPPPQQQQQQQQQEQQEQLQQQRRQHQHQQQQQQQQQPQPPQPREPVPVRHPPQAPPSPPPPPPPPPPPARNGGDGPGGEHMIWESTAPADSGSPGLAPRRDSAASRSSVQSAANDSDSQFYTTTDDEVDQQQRRPSPPRSGTADARRRGRSTTQPYWCHECQRGIQALMAPAPTCPHCRGQFVEEVDEEHSVESFVNGSGDETDGEYERVYQELQNADPARSRQSGTGSSVPFMTFFTVGPVGATVTRVQTPSNAAGGAAGQRRPRSLAEAFQNATNQAARNLPTAANSAPPSEAGPQQANSAPISGAQTGGSMPSEGAASAGPNTGQSQTSRQANFNNFAAGLVPGLLAEFLGAMLGQPPEGQNQQQQQQQQQNPGQFFVQQIFHLASNPGDYVFGQNALDNIITAMMEQQQGQNAPPPVPEDVLNNLPRLIIGDTEVSTGADCAVCKDEFALRDNTVKLPCTHLFHEECIIPWLKVNGTCPMCRYSLVTGSENANETSTTSVQTPGAAAGEPPQMQTSAPPWTIDTDALPPPDPVD